MYALVAALMFASVGHATEPDTCSVIDSTQSDAQSARADYRVARSTHFLRTDWSFRMAVVPGDEREELIVTREDRLNEIRDLRQDAHVARHRAKDVRLAVARGDLACEETVSWLY